MLGTHYPHTEAGRGAVLQVPTLWLVDVPGQDAPAIRKPEGLEVLSSGGHGILAVAAVGSHMDVMERPQNLSSLSPPIHSQRYLPLCYAVLAQQAGHG